MNCIYWLEYIIKYKNIGTQKIISPCYSRQIIIIKDSYLGQGWADKTQLNRKNYWRWYFCWIYLSEAVILKWTRSQAKIASYLDNWSFREGDAASFEKNIYFALENIGKLSEIFPGPPFQVPSYGDIGSTSSTLLCSSIQPGAK